jgi:hypothetical protein
MIIAGDDLSGLINNISMCELYKSIMELYNTHAIWHSTFDARKIQSH